MSLSKTVVVQARSKWNATGIIVSAGETLRVQGSGTWYDWGIPSPPSGYDRPYLAPFRRFRRKPDAPWFALIGALDCQPATSFTIDFDQPQVMIHSGALFLYANDVPWAYWNNEGSVDVLVSKEP